MDRKKFIRNSLAGLGGIVSIPTLITGAKEYGSTNLEAKCDLSPRETSGPFPIKTPSDYVRENIVGDRSGVALLITLTIHDQSNGCKPMQEVIVDVWQCDAAGGYSEYGGNRMQQTDYTSKHFLRGRQKTNVHGQVTFISIFPGWYPGRAPHIHVEVKDLKENSIRVTQIAFPSDVCNTVYATSGYRGEANTSNERDGIFSNSLDGNMLDSITGDIKQGYTLLKIIVV